MAVGWNCAFAKTHLTRCQHSVSLTAADKLKSLNTVKQLLDGLSVVTSSHCIWCLLVHGND